MRVLITGASRGIGAGCARALARHGHDLALIARSADQLEELASELTGAGTTAVWAKADVSDHDDLQRAVNSCIDSLGGLDAAVVNAGVSIRKPLTELGLDAWRTMVDVNLHGAVHTALTTIPAIKRAGGGHLVFISSISGRLPLKNGSGYAASKWGVSGLAESLFQELRDDGIKVSLIYPGSVATKLVEDGDEGPDPAMMVQPEEVGEAIQGMLAMPGNTMIHRLEIRPLRKPG